MLRNLMRLAPPMHIPLHSLLRYSKEPITRTKAGSGQKKELRAETSLAERNLYPPPPAHANRVPSPFPASKPTCEAQPYGNTRNSGLSQHAHKPSVQMGVAWFRMVSPIPARHQWRSQSSRAGCSVTTVSRTPKSLTTYEHFFYFSRTEDGDAGR